jgi:hypothetical protein
LEKQAPTTLVEAYWMADHLEGVEGTKKSPPQKQKNQFKKKKNGTMQKGAKLSIIMNTKY